MMADVVEMPKVLLPSPPVLHVPMALWRLDAQGVLRMAAAKGQFLDRFAAHPQGHQQRR
jgi:hypothetical protein